MGYIVKAWIIVESVEIYSVIIRGSPTWENLYRTEIVFSLRKQGQNRDNEGYFATGSARISPLINSRSSRLTCRV